MRQRNWTAGYPVITVTTESSQAIALRFRRPLAVRGAVAQDNLDTGITHNELTGYVDTRSRGSAAWPIGFGGDVMHGGNHGEADLRARFLRRCRPRLAG